MQEELNNVELTKTVADIDYNPDHKSLLTALQERIPDFAFRLIAVRDGFYSQPGIIDRDGNRVSNSLDVWIDNELAEANGDANKVWIRHKHEGLIKTAWVGEMLYLTAPSGPEADDYLQLEIMCEQEMTVQTLFNSDPIWVPEDRHDLVFGNCSYFSDCRRTLLSPFRYQFDRLTNIQPYLQNLAKKAIDWRDQESSAVRLFRDWQESTPGISGNRYCDHWFAKLGRHQPSLIPQWADADGGLELPEIFPDCCASPYGVMESLIEFDAHAGYPFAWYFYMLHGNRIGSNAGSIIAEAIEDGKMKPLPECDEQVLLRWNNQKYGF